MTQLKAMSLAASAAALLATSCGSRAETPAPAPRSDHAIADLSHLDGGPPTDGPPADGAPAVDLGPLVDGTLVDGTLVDGAPADSALADGAPPAVVDNTLPARGWYERAEASCDRDHLGAAFAQVGYSPPPGTYLIAGRIEPGLQQLASRCFSLGPSGFSYSSGAYWPASTIKLSAAVGALWTLGKHGLSGAAQVTFTDDDGSYDGTVRKLYEDALIVSNNVAYNRLMEIAGFDEINQQYLTPAGGQPLMVLQRRYTHPSPSSNLRTSPAITYLEGSKQGTIPARTGTSQHPSCPDEGNCTTLFELVDVIRRVTLADELAAVERFPLRAADRQGLKEALRQAKSTISAAAASALGGAPLVYNKPGEVWGDDRLDHGVIVDTTTGARYLLGWSMPYNSTSSAVATELGRQALLALTLPSDAAAPLQRDAGIPLLVNVTDLGATGSPALRRHRITVGASGADQIELWLDRWPLPPPTPVGDGRFELEHQMSAGGARLLVVRAHAGGALVGHRAAWVSVTPP